MAIAPDYVREVFKGLETGDGAAFFKHVADGVDWRVMGTHPLAGHYRSKRAFQEATFGRLGKVLPKGAQLRLTNVIVAADMAVVELVSDALTTTIAGWSASTRAALLKSAPILIPRWWPNCFARNRFDADRGNAFYGNARGFRSVRRSMTVFGTIRPRLMAKMIMMAVMPSDVVA
jgi:ketosteroid isomerase-like protein